MTRTISVIGTGYLGAVHAACMAELGHDVVAVDVDRQRVEALAAGSAPFFEPGLDALLARVLSTGRLRFTCDYDDIAEADVHFICVGTPQSSDGRTADTSYVFSAVESLASRLRPGALVVGKSTVPVGTADAILTRLRATAPTPGEVRLAWNPEFLREGTAIDDTLRPSRLVYGVHPDSAEQDIELLDEIYAPALALGVPRLVTDFETAELVKVAANAFLATKISFINSMADLCDVAGADVVQLAQALGLDDRIGPKFLGAGLGYGGGCLPKDVRALAARSEELGADACVTLLSHVNAINESRQTKMLDLARTYCSGSLRGKAVAILGAAFKPNSDDLRESPSLEVAMRALREGATVTVHDPRALDAARLAYPHLRYEENVEEACRGADILLHLTEWEEYRKLDIAKLTRLVRTPVILDGRNALHGESWSMHGWTYVSIGRPALIAGLPAEPELARHA